MLLLLQLAFCLAFLCYLVLAIYDAIRGGFIILTGLGLLVIGITLKAIAFVTKKIHAAPTAPVVVPTTPRVWTWKVIASK